MEDLMCQNHVSSATIIRGEVPKLKAVSVWPMPDATDELGCTPLNTLDQDLIPTVKEPPYGITILKV